MVLVSKLELESILDLKKYRLPRLAMQGSQ